MPDYQGEFGAYPSTYFETGSDDKGEHPANPAAFVKPIAAPVFGGVTSVLGMGGPATFLVEWAPATDAAYPSSTLTYLVYQGDTLPLDYTYPSHTVLPGFPPAVNAFGPIGQSTYFGVRAMNPAGVVDANTVTLSAMPESDTQPPYWNGLLAGVRRNDNEDARLWWQYASDNNPFQDSADIDILIYLSETEGGQNFAAPPFHVEANDSAGCTLTGLDPSKDYWAVARARDDYGNTTTNTAETPLLRIGAGNSDSTPPTVTDIVPAPGTPIGRQQIVSVTVEDAIGLRRVLLTVTLGGVTEVAHTGEGFVAPYSLGSYDAPTANGRRYHLKRTGGWTAPPTFSVYAFDVDGNEV